MPNYEPIDYRLRCHSKRTDLPPDVLRDICEAYETIQRLTKERDKARREYCRGFTDFFPNPAHEDMTLEEAAMDVAKSFGWDCFKENADAR